MNTIKTTSKLETFLFGFTRTFAIFGSTIGLAILILFVLGLFFGGEDTYVSLDDLDTSTSIEQDDVSSASATKHLIRSDEVERYLSGDNEKILNDWLNSINGIEKKQDFLDNLTDIIDDAESEGVDVINAINSYKVLKLAKYKKSIPEQLEESGQAIAKYFVIFGLIIFVSLMSLILVMLSIERNTRSNKLEDI